MSSYKNNKDGTLTLIATNNHISQGLPQEGFVTEGELVEAKTELYKYNGEMGAKNLIPFPYYEDSKIKQGVTFTVNDNGSLHVYYSEGFSLWTQFNLVYSKNVFKAGDYIISVQDTLPIGAYIQVLDVDNNNQTIVSLSYNTPLERLFTITDAMVQNNHTIRVMVNLNPNYTYDFTTFPMIRMANDSDPTYQPYVLTNKQLTQETIDIYDLIGKVSTKNLIPTPYYYNSRTINGIVYTVNDDGSIIFSGTATNNSTFLLNDSFQTYIHSGTYILNANQSSSLTNITFALTDETDGSSLAYISGDILTSVATITDEMLNHRLTIRIVVGNGTIISNPITIYPMLRYAEDKSDTYAQYAPTNNELNNDVTQINNVINTFDIFNWTRSMSNSAYQQHAKLNINHNIITFEYLEDLSFDESTWIYALAMCSIKDLINNIQTIKFTISNPNYNIGGGDYQHIIRMLGLSANATSWSTFIPLAEYSQIIQKQNGDIYIDFQSVYETYKNTIDGWDNVYLLVGLDERISSNVYPKATMSVSVVYYPIINYQLSKQPKIICWGDSLTAGGGWTTVLAEKSGLNVLNGGVGGENAKCIMARQGGDIMIINNVAIPSTTTPITIATRSTDVGISTQLGNKVTPLLQGNGSNLNPVVIGNVTGNLQWTGTDWSDVNGTWTFTRTVSGDTEVIDRPTAIRTSYDMLYNDEDNIMIIFMGQNGGYTDNADLVHMHKLMIDHFQGKEYVVLGLSSGTSASRADYEAAMTEAFGRRFISLRQYLAHPIYDGNNNIVSCYGLADQGLTPTADDLDKIAVGQVPAQCLADSVHYTAGTKTVIGNMLYKKMCELNIL